MTQTSPLQTGISRFAQSLNGTQQFPSDSFDKEGTSVLELEQSVGS